MSCFRIGYRVIALVAVFVVVPPANAVDQLPPDDPAQEFAASWAGVTRLDVQSIDRAAVAEEDLDRAARDLPPRFAIPKPVSAKPESVGSWDVTEDGAHRWRLRIAAPDALSVNLGFSRFHMPSGGRLTLYDAEARQPFRSFTELDNEPHGELWTPPVPGAELLLEVIVPASERSRLEIELASVNYGYRPFGPGTDAAALSGSCNVDVICPEGDDWRLEIPSVGVISTGGSTFCTGFMVNNTSQDLTPFFMTAAHCGINSGNASSLVVYWNYENSTCRPPGSPASGGPGDGSLSTFQTGSFFRSSYSPSDMTLVELDDDPDPAWNLSWAGWDRSTGDHLSAVAIHHPNTDEKRISFENDPTATTSYLGTTSPGDGTHVRVIDWDLGTTEPGSSGSPLFNQDHRVIGQLHGGGAACGNNDSDYYGRFSLSWTGGGSNATRLSNWLDPTSTGATAVDTLSGGGMSVAPAGDVLHIGLVGGPFSNPSVVYTLTNPTPDPVDYKVSLTSSFGVLLDGATADVTGTLAALGGTVDVTVSLGAAIDALPAGVYLEDVVFQDMTNGLSTTRRHTVEIGQTRIAVTPAFNLETGGPLGGPFTGSQVYTVTSERPTPVTVEVSANQPWVTLNGSDTPIILNLSGVGDFDTVTVAIGPDAHSLSAGIYGATVSFVNLNDGAGDALRTVTLDVGRIVYASTDTPKAINDNLTTTSNITVADNYCIGDINVDIDITHTYIGDLIVELRSPANTVVRLHNRTGSSADDILQTYDDEGFAPDGPGALSNFDFEASAGIWTLTVSDNAGGDVGTLNSWALRIAPAGDVCPPQAHNMSLVVNQGDPVDIDLSGAGTSGEPLDFIIESLPAAGVLSDPNGGTINSVPYTLLANGNKVHYEPQAAQRRASGVPEPIFAYPGDFDEFLFSVDDGQASATATVALAADPGWSRQGQWAFGIPTGGGTNGGDPTSGHTGLNVFGYNLNGNYANNMSATYLTTGAHDCTNLMGTELRFRRWLGMESSQFDQATIQISTNGSTWSTVWAHSGASFNEATWSLQTYNISAAADGQPTVYIRWGIGPTDGSVTYPGWNLDDIEIWGIDLGATVDPPLAAPPPHDGPKNRYLSFVPNNGTNAVAFRVDMTAGPGGAMSVGWVDTPDGSGIALLAPTPVTRVWNEPLVHVGACGIVPVAVYDIVATPDGVVFSDPLAVATILEPSPKLWGDTVGDFAGSWNGPNGLVNVNDFLAAVQKFQGTAGAPHLTWVDVHDEVPNAVINFTDVFQLLKAFQGDAYPFSLPANCP